MYPRKKWPKRGGQPTQPSVRLCHINTDLSLVSLLPTLPVKPSEHPNYFLETLSMGTICHQENTRRGISNRLAGNTGKLAIYFTEYRCKHNEDIVLKLREEQEISQCSPEDFFHCHTSRKKSWQVRRLITGHKSTILGNLPWGLLLLRYCSIATITACELHVSAAAKCHRCISIILGSINCFF